MFAKECRALLTASCDAQRLSHLQSDECKLSRSNSQTDSGGGAGADAISGCKFGEPKTGLISGSRPEALDESTPYATGRSVYSLKYAMRNSEMASISVNGSFPIRSG